MLVNSALTRSEAVAVYRGFIAAGLQAVLRP
jgi:hypothetical protein